MNTKTFARLAALGTVMSLNLPQVQAQTPPAPAGGTKVEMTDINPDGTPVNASGKNPTLFAATGEIEEFIQFTLIDDTLELGDLGGPNAIGERVSLKVAESQDNGTVEVTRASGENGIANIEFGSNTYVRVLSSHSRLRNAGPDGIRATGNAASDDAVLPTQFARSYFGRQVFRNGSLLANTQTAYSNWVPWSGLVTDGSSFQRVDFAPATRNGMKYRARVTRNGLNDYNGAYTTAINLTYYKY